MDLLFASVEHLRTQIVCYAVDSLAVMLADVLATDRCEEAIAQMESLCRYHSINLHQDIPASACTGTSHGTTARGSQIADTTDENVQVNRTAIAPSGTESVQQLRKVHTKRSADEPEKAHVHHDA